jgi:hypothetical protein
MRWDAYPKIPGLLKDLAKQGIMILAMPEHEYWIGVRVEPFDINLLEIEVVHI